MDVAIHVGVFSGPELVGRIRFDSLIHQENQSHYAMTPADILSREDVEAVRRVLCCLPQVNEGKVAGFWWRAANSPVVAERASDRARVGAFANSRTIRVGNVAARC